MPAPALRAARTNDKSLLARRPATSTVSRAPGPSSCHLAPPSNDWASTQSWPTSSSGCAGSAPRQVAGGREELDLRVGDLACDQRAIVLEPGPGAQRDVEALAHQVHRARAQSTSTRSSGWRVPKRTSSSPRKASPGWWAR